MSHFDENSRQFRQEIVGKRISGVIARPGRNGEPPMVMMLHFEDGSVVEFVSPRSDRLLRKALVESRDRLSGGGGSRAVKRRCNCRSAGWPPEMQVTFFLFQGVAVFIHTSCG
jgi:hypothetical protein